MEYNLKLPFVLVLNACRGSGKTFLLINMLINEQMYKGKFDKVFFVCPTYYLDPKYSLLNLPESQVFTTFDEEQIKKIVKNKNPNHEYLIVLDDCITQAGFKQNKPDNILNLLACNGRHMKVSLLITSQKTSGTSTYVRSQSDGVILFRPRTLAEIDSIYEDSNVMLMEKKRFIELVKFCTDEQYSFMYINKQTGKVYKKFDKIELGD